MFGEDERRGYQLLAAMAFSTAVILAALTVVLFVAVQVFGAGGTSFAPAEAVSAPDMTYLVALHAVISGEADAPCGPVQAWVLVPDRKCYGSVDRAG